MYKNFKMTEGSGMESMHGALLDGESGEFLDG